MNMRVGSYCCFCGHKFSECECPGPVSTTVSGTNFEWPNGSPKPHKCPVCNGDGEYRTGSLSTTLGPAIKRCHGCDGKGWVTV